MSSCSWIAATGNGRPGSRAARRLTTRTRTPAAAMSTAAMLTAIGALSLGRRSGSRRDGSGAGAGGCSGRGGTLAAGWGDGRCGLCAGPDSPSCVEAVGGAAVVVGCVNACADWASCAGKLWPPTGVLRGKVRRNWILGQSRRGLAWLPPAAWVVPSSLEVGSGRRPWARVPLRGCGNCWEMGLWSAPGELDAGGGVVIVVAAFRRPEILLLRGPKAPRCGNQRYVPGAVL